MPNQFIALGNKVTEGDLEVIQFKPAIDPISKSEHWGLLREVTFTCDEVTALCPVTGQPDQYIVEIKLSILNFSIESKSLKLYLQKYRNQGIFAEQLCQQICIDVVRAAHIGSCSVILKQKSRGGISLVAKAEWS